MNPNQWYQQNKSPHYTPRNPPFHPPYQRNQPSQYNTQQAPPHRQYPQNYYQGQRQASYPQQHYQQQQQNQQQYWNQQQQQPTISHHRGYASARLRSPPSQQTSQIPPPLNYSPSQQVDRQDSARSYSSGHSLGQVERQDSTRSYSSGGHLTSSLSQSPQNPKNPKNRTPRARGRAASNRSKISSISPKASARKTPTKIPTTIVNNRFCTSDDKKRTGRIPQLLKIYTSSSVTGAEADNQEDSARNEQRPSGDSPPLPPGVSPPKADGIKATESIHLTPSVCPPKARQDSKSVAIDQTSKSDGKDQLPSSTDETQSLDQTTGSKVSQDQPPSSTDETHPIDHTKTEATDQLPSGTDKAEHLDHTKTKGTDQLPSFTNAALSSYKKTKDIQDTSTSTQINKQTARTPSRSEDTQNRLQVNVKKLVEISPTSQELKKFYESLPPDIHSEEQSELDDRDKEQTKVDDKHKRKENRCDQREELIDQKDNREDRKDNRWDQREKQINESDKQKDQSDKLKDLSDKQKDQSDKQKEQSNKQKDQSDKQKDQRDKPRDQSDKQINERDDKTANIDAQKHTVSISGFGGAELSVPGGPLVFAGKKRKKRLFSEISNASSSIAKTESTHEKAASNKAPDIFVDKSALDFKPASARVDAHSSDPDRHTDNKRRKLFTETVSKNTSQDNSVNESALDSQTASARVEGHSSDSKRHTENKRRKCFTDSSKASTSSTAKTETTPQKAVTDTHSLIEELSEPLPDLLAESMAAATPEKKLTLSPAIKAKFSNLVRKSDTAKRYLGAIIIDEDEGEDKRTEIATSATKTSLSSTAGGNQDPKRTMNVNQDPKPTVKITRDPKTTVKINQDPKATPSGNKDAKTSATDKRHSKTSASGSKNLKTTTSNRQETSVNQTVKTNATKSEEKVKSVTTTPTDEEIFPSSIWEHESENEEVDVDISVGDIVPSSSMPFAEPSASENEEVDVVDVNVCPIDIDDSHDDDDVPSFSMPLEAPSENEEVDIEECNDNVIAAVSSLNIDMEESSKTVQESAKVVHILCDSTNTTSQAKKVEESCKESALSESHTNSLHKEKAIDIDMDMETSKAVHILCDSTNTTSQVKHVDQTKESASLYKLSDATNTSQAKSSDHTKESTASESHLNRDSLLKELESKVKSVSKEMPNSVNSVSKTSTNKSVSKEITSTDKSVSKESAFTIKSVSKESAFTIIKSVSKATSPTEDRESAPIRRDSGESSKSDSAAPSKLDASDEEKKMSETGVTSTGLEPQTSTIDEQEESEDEDYDPLNDSFNGCGVDLSESESSDDDLQEMDTMLKIHQKEKMQSQPTTPVKETLSVSVSDMSVDQDRDVAAAPSSPSQQHDDSIAPQDSKDTPEDEDMQPEYEEERSSNSSDSDENLPPPVPLNSLDALMQHVTTNVQVENELTEMDRALLRDLQQGGIRHVAKQPDEDVTLQIDDTQNLMLQRLKVKKHLSLDQPPAEDIVALEREGCLFRENTLKLEHCGYQQGSGIVDKSLSSLPQVVQVEYLLDGTLLMVPKLKTPKAVLQWLFYMMSIHRNLNIVRRIYELFYQVLHQHMFPEWFPSPLDLLRALTNLGCDPKKLCRKSSPIQFKAEELSVIPGTNPFIETSSPTTDPEEPASTTTTNTSTHPPSQAWLQKVRCVLHTVQLAVRLRPRSYTKDNTDMLQSLMLMVAALSTDHMNSNDQMTLDCKACLVSIFCVVKEEQWVDWCQRVVVALSGLRSHHHGRVHLCQQLGGEAGRAVFIQRHLATAMLHDIMRKNQPQPDTVHNAEGNLPHVWFLVRHIHPSSDTDNYYYLLSSIISLIDLSVGRDPLTDADQTIAQDISDYLSKLQGKIRESMHSIERSYVKDQITRLTSKWSFMWKDHSKSKADNTTVRMYNWSNREATLLDVPEEEAEERAALEEEADDHSDDHFDDHSDDHTDHADDDHRESDDLKEPDDQEREEEALMEVDTEEEEEEVHQEEHMEEDLSDIADQS